MRHTRSAYFAALALAALALTGCATSAPAGGGAIKPGTAQNPGGSGTQGHATVAVDGKTWEYDSFLCAVGYEQTQSDKYSFSSTAFSTSDGEKIQFLIDVLDDSGQNRVSGDGVEYQIELFDHGNPSNPSIAISAQGTTGVTVSEGSVKVSGVFVDGADSYSIEADVVCNG